jgi:hypothetical protein
MEPEGDEFQKVETEAARLGSEAGRLWRKVTRLMV